MVTRNSLQRHLTNSRLLLLNSLARKVQSYEGTKLETVKNIISEKIDLSIIASY